MVVPTDAGPGWRWPVLRSTPLWKAAVGALALPCHSRRKETLDDLKYTFSEEFVVVLLVPTVPDRRPLQPHRQAASPWRPGKADHPVPCPTPGARCPRGQAGLRAPHRVAPQLERAGDSSPVCKWSAWGVPSCQRSLPYRGKGAPGPGLPPPWPPLGRLARTRTRPSRAPNLHGRARAEVGRFVPVQDKPRQPQGLCPRRRAGAFRGPCCSHLGFCHFLPLLSFFFL